MTPPKENVPPVVYIPISTQQRNLCNLHNIENRFEEGYDSDGEAGPLCDVDLLEGNEVFYEGDLPGVSPIDAGEKSSDNEVNESVFEGGNKSNNDS